MAKTAATLIDTATQAEAAIKSSAADLGVETLLERVDDVFQNASRSRPSGTSTKMIAGWDA